MDYEEQEREPEQNADQWAAGGTVPDVDETWTIPMDDPDATVPLRRTHE
jgi:hypothetical protein